MIFLRRPSVCVLWEESKQCLLFLNEQLLLQYHIFAFLIIGLLWIATTDNEVQNNWRVVDDVSELGSMDNRGLLLICMNYNGW